MNRLRPYLPLVTALVLTAALTLLAMNNQNNLLFWVVGVVMAGLVLSALYSHLVVRFVEVKRLDPKHGAAGEPLVVHYAVTNRSRFIPIFNLHVAEVPRRGQSNWSRFMRPAGAWVMHVGPRETVHGEAVFWPRRRGEARFELMRVETSFPFGLVRRTRRFLQPAHTLIFPRLYHLRPRVMDAIIPAGPLGLKLSHRPGGGDDYFGLREYKPGDSRRQIAWKRSAGSSALIIKERTLPSPPRLRIVLNLSLSTKDLEQHALADTTASELEERSISLAATIVEAAHSDGFEVGLTVLGFEMPATPLRQSHWHVEKIMGALASINLELPRNKSSRRLTPDTERAGIVIIHPGRVDLSIGREDGWHFSATQIDHLVSERTTHAHKPGPTSPVKSASTGAAA